MALLKYSLLCLVASAAGDKLPAQYQGGGGSLGGGFAGDPRDAFNALGEAIPGQAGEDYPIFSEVPETSFSCDGQVDGGYYADPEAECQAFHICAGSVEATLSRYSFLCPNGSLFNQEYFVCDWWFNVDCSQAESLYSLNDEIAAEREANSPDSQGSYGGQGGQNRGSGGQRKGGNRGASSNINNKYSAPTGGYSTPVDPGYSSPASGYGAPADSGYGAPDASADSGYGAPGASADSGYASPIANSGGYDAPSLADSSYSAPPSNSYGGVQPIRRRGRTGRRG